MSTSIEQWKPVKGFEGVYEVSDQGRIRRLTTRVGRVRQEPRLLKAHISAFGYERVFLYRTSRIRRYVHNIVMEAFVGDRPEKYDVNHKDGNRANNALSNLEYLTRAENIRHGRDVLGHVGGGKKGQPTYKLTPSAVREIRTLHEQHGVSRLELSRRYNVHTSTIRGVINRETWKEIS